MTTQKTDRGMALVQGYAPNSKAHLGYPSRFRGHVVLACTGRTIEGYIVRYIARYGTVTCGACQKKGETA